MAKYGIPFQGSKSSIADELIASLPSGNRFVDLFGGGFAMSECALLSRKWKKVLYNDINPLLIPLIRDAIDGKYNYENFTPEWISREDFFQRKESDGYIKWCWSFANDGNWYLYGRDIEETKHKLHDYIVFRTQVEGLENIESTNISDRRLYVTKKFLPDSIGRLDNLTRLERIQRLSGLKTDNLQMTCMNYLDYEYQDGDVVYCDIPYQNGYENRIGQKYRTEKNYQTPFNHGEFYQWAISRPYPVYFSSYKLGNVVWERNKRVLKGTDNKNVRREVLYCVSDDSRKPKKLFQGVLFNGVM